MNKFVVILFLSSAIVLTGSGCIKFGTPKPVDRSYLKDASAFSRPSTTTLPTDEQKYVPPPPAPPLPPPPVPTAPGSPINPSAPASPAQTAPVNTPPAAPTYNRPQSSDMDYNDAVNIYRKSGYYIEFLKCRGLPPSITIKKNDRLMIDNRDNVGHQIIIGNNLYELGPFDFTIIRAPATPLNYYIYCDGISGALLKVQS